MLPNNSGLPYTSHTELIEKIVSLKRNKFSYPGHDLDDQAQDIRLICWEALKKFDEAKLGKSLFHYLARCVDNALYNKFRGVYLDNNPPCIRCEHYNKQNKTCAIDEIGCDRILQYRSRMEQKRSIAAPLSYNISINNEGEEELGETFFIGSTTGVHDLIDSVRSSLDSELVPYYDIIIAGGIVPNDIHRVIKEQVKIILE